MSVGHRPQIHSELLTGSGAVGASLEPRRSWAVPLLQLLCVACPEEAWLLLCELSGGLKDSRPITSPADIQLTFIARRSASIACLAILTIRLQR